MRIATRDVPVKISAPGATARQKTEFGSTEGYRQLSGEHFSMAAGTDISPLLEGLEGNLCQSPHWGYLIEGKLAVTFSDGHREDVSAHDLFYWPPGHTVRAEEDTEFVLFSPQHEHGQVLDHMRAKLAE